MTARIDFSGVSTRLERIFSMTQTYDYIAVVLIALMTLGPLAAAAYGL